MPSRTESPSLCAIHFPEVMKQQEHDSSDGANISQLVNTVNKYIDTRTEYTRLTLLEKIGVALTKWTTMEILLRLLFFFVLFLGIGAAIWIGKYYDNYALGFFIIAGVFLIKVLSFLLMRKSVFEKRILDSFITALCAEHDAENDDEDEE